MSVMRFMEKARPGTVAGSARGEALTARELQLAGIIDSYSAVTERLKESHDALTGQVKRLRGELRKKDRELARRERLAALGEMAAGVAHEVRNPLGGILLYANMLQRDPGDGAGVKRAAAQIVDAVRKVERVVGDVLAFAGDRMPRCRLVALGEVVGGVVEGLRDVLKPGCVIHVGEVRTDDRADIDPGLMQRALGNLAANAVDAAGERGNVWIGIESSQERAGWLRVVVADDGPGVPGADRDRIFNPFYTTKEHGTGLGLAIAHRIVESHGGRLTVGDRAGGGAEFVIHLQRRRRPAAESRGDRSRSREYDGTGGRGFVEGRGSRVRAHVPKSRSLVPGGTAPTDRHGQDQEDSGDRPGSLVHGTMAFETVHRISTVVA